MTAAYYVRLLNNGSNTYASRVNIFFMYTGNKYKRFTNFTLIDYSNKLLYIL